jgi:hypothetical protein
MDYIKKGDAVLIEVIHPKDGYGYVYEGLLTCDFDEDGLKPRWNQPIIFANPQTYCFGVKDLHKIEISDIEIEAIQTKRVKRIIKKRGYAWILIAKVVLP